MRNSYIEIVSVSLKCSILVFTLHKCYTTIQEIDNRFVMRRIYVNRKWKVIGVLSIIGFSIFFIEVISNVINTHSWVQFKSIPDNAKPNDEAEHELHKDEALRILIVADPQIQGEKFESRYFGWLTRWDSDRYLYKNYRLAKHHVDPHLLLFMGDLFDEGSKATDQEYKRYFRRFEDIFDLPVNVKTDKNYIFIPGDNDVGGEGGEIIDLLKLKLFNHTFGDYRGVYWLRNSDWSTQFFKLNMFLPDVYKNPLNGLTSILNSELPDYRIVLSHMPLLNIITQSVQTVIDKISPSLVITAHSHRSSFFRFESGTDNSLHVTPEFLLAHRHTQKHGTTTSTVSSNTKRSTEDALPMPESTSIRFHMQKVPEHKKESMIYEINVPTCSYRMGVDNMGFGSLQIFKNGTVDYTVLWLPSRFKQLYFYLFFYILGKLIVTPWLFCKLACFSFNRFRMWQSTRYMNHNHSV